ncbi:MAG: nitronate monooxygenase [Pseudomonadota bacterium]|nr:nitronate monooxygenase [Pseudomonadota bacterium]
MTLAAAPTATQLLGIAHPIVLGPFGGGLSTVALAATVSNLGGLGSFGAHSLSADRVADVTAEVRALTNAPFAINLWVSDHDAGGLSLTRAQFDRAFALFESWYRELEVHKPDLPERYHPSFALQIEALLAARPPVFSFVFGIPEVRILAECRRLGIVTIGAATSIAEAQALDAAGVDLIVATGAEAGGHRPSFLQRAEDSLIGTFTLVQLIAARVRAPVVAAGGIVDARGVRAVLALGAQAAQIGTAFLACAESGTHDLHREALFSAQAQHTVLTRSFTGRLARGIRNRWTDELGQPSATSPPFPVQSWFVSHLRAPALKAGRSDLISLWSGQIAPNLHHRSAHELMNALIED